MRLSGILLIAAVFGGNTVSAQQIVVDLDIESANYITELLGSSKISEEQLNKATALYGNRQLIQKVKGYSGAGADVFKETLKEIIESGTIKGNDPYNWKKSRSVLPQMKELMKVISANRTQFTSDLASRIAAYSPDSLGMNVRACFLVGGGSLGFTLGDDSTFNVALQNIGDDVEGLKILIAHELYHSVQAAGQNRRKKETGKKPTYNVEAAYAILSELWAEGTANFVGDFTKNINPKAFSRAQIDNYTKNSNRNRTGFYLLETVLYHAYNDTTADYQQLYNIGFTTEFDEIFYGVGYEMARKIAEHRGNAALSELVVSDPILFIHGYITLYREKKESRFFRFGSVTEQIVEELMRWKDRI